MKALSILSTILKDEEYEDMECVASGFTKTYLEKAISELGTLQQHIKSLEAQLANTGQLKCDGCINKPNAGDNYDAVCGHCRRFYGDHYTTIEVYKMDIPYNFAQEYLSVFEPDTSKTVCGQCKFFTTHCTTSKIEAKYGDARTPSCSEFKPKDTK